MGNVNFKLPKKEYDQVVVLSQYVQSSDAVLNNGRLGFLDLTGLKVLDLKLSDIIKGGKVAYSAGAAHKRRVALASISLTANTEYRLTIVVPNRVDFFDGGKETNPLNTIRTYSWASGATAPTAAAVRDAFIAIVNADLYDGVTASANSTSNLDILADSADAGQLQISFSDANATFSDVTAYAAPVGTTSEIEGLAPGKSESGITYHRYEFVYRKIVRNNTVSGLQVIKPVKAVVYANINQAAFLSVVDNFLAGTISVANLATVGTEVAKYFAVPAL